MRIAAIAGVCLLLVQVGVAEPQPPTQTKGLPELAANKKKPPLPPSQLPLQFIKQERIAFVGNSLAERMNLFGYFEAMLHDRYPDLELVIRNFGRPGDEVGLRQRPADYTKIDDPIKAFNPDTFICFFGFNESFAGTEGLEKFKLDYENFIDEFSRKYPRDAAGSPPRFVLVTPAPATSSEPLHAQESALLNQRLQHYRDAIQEIAQRRRLACIDLFSHLMKELARGPIEARRSEARWTVNGIHYNEAGYEKIGLLLMRLMTQEAVPANDHEPSHHGRLRDDRIRDDRLRDERFRQLLRAVNDKSWLHMQDYRMLNGWYVYGGRRTFDTETFPQEIVKLRKMVAVRDRYIWDIAQGKPVPEQPDDSSTGELTTPPTRFGHPSQKYSEGLTPEILPPAEFLKTCTMPEGFELRLFADEGRFPEIANPVQINFDSKGRLWVATMPSYPQWRPGDPRPADQLVILEDTDGDGVADKSTVFYDKLHCPTGFEFYNGGVIVVDQPRLIFLRDSNGDDRADEITHLLDGFGTDDTHHTIGAFEWSHGGNLKMLEGVSMSTTVETPWGPFRNYGNSGCYTLDPRTLRLRHYATPGYGNPWCYVFNEWGHGFVGDGTGGQQHWDTLLDGPQFPARRGVQPTVDPKGMRPVCGSEFLKSRHFPKEMHDDLVTGCVINLNGLPRFRIKEEGSGYRGTRVANLLQSTDKHFRPVDPQIGPDGALWFGDWANPLIGHMQYSQRDPNRDRRHGRIYRLLDTRKPLLKPVTQHGKPIAELLEQLLEYEDRTRYRARRELWARPWTELEPVLKQWMEAEVRSAAPNYQVFREALWVMQGHGRLEEDWAVMILTGCEYADEQAAAVRMIADEWQRLPNAKSILIRAASHESPRVRIEAVRGLSYFKDPEAIDAVLSAAKLPMDDMMRHVVLCALGATETAWAGRYYARQIGQDDITGPLLEEVLTSSKVGAAAVPWLKILLAAEPPSAEERNKALTALAELPGGDARRGRSVFKSAGCTACHKLHGEGQEYGPDLSRIANLRTRFHLVESLIDPNADVDRKYLATRLVTVDGTSMTGLVVSEADGKVVIFDGKERRTVLETAIESRTALKQSSMPEGLASTMSAAEFLDLIAFLASLR